MIFFILLCLGAFGFLVQFLRARGGSVGLTIGYLYLLLLIHVPGAVAHALPWSLLPEPELTATGIRLTSFGCLAFVAGAWLASRGRRNMPPLAVEAAGRRFLTFCVAGGWIALFVVLPFVARMPSVRALVDEGGMIWMLGVMLGLVKALRAGRKGALAVWLLLLSVYPAVILIKDGFLSFGMNAAILCLAPLVLATRSAGRAWAGVGVVTVVGMGLFATYFSMRQELRKVIWGNEEFEERIAESSRILSDFKFFDAQDEETLTNVNDRLNQNYFVGLAHGRLKRGIVDHYKGRTVMEGLMALVPRALWPGKPVYGGSPEIIETMTGFKVAKGTSYGVGNVMEFYINFGMPSLLAGFLLLGWVLGKLDAAAAGALAAGNIKGLILCVLPAIAVIQPDKSVVEMSGGAAAALVAAWLWGIFWDIHCRGQAAAALGESMGRPGPLGGRGALPSKPNRVKTEEESDWEVQPNPERDEFRF